MARAQGARSQFAAAFESVYGTAPVGGFHKLPFVSTTLGSEQGLIPSDLLGLGRDPAEPIRDVINVDGDVVVRLYKGRAEAVKRRSPNSLFHHGFATFGEDEVYDHKHSEGFIRLFSLPMRIRALLGLSADAAKAQSHASQHARAH